MKSLKELQAIRESMKKQLNTRDSSDNDIRIVVGMATCGIAAGARAVLSAFLDEVEKRNLTNVKVGQTGCIGMCKCEPMAEVFVPGHEKVTYVHLTDQKVREIVNSHIMFGKPIAEYMFK